MQRYGLRLHITIKYRLLAGLQSPRRAHKLIRRDTEGKKGGEGQEWQTFRYWLPTSQADWLLQGQLREGKLERADGSQAD